MSECNHDEFQAVVGVHRLAEHEGGPIRRYTADVKIRCKACGLPFRFLGVDRGMSFSRPTTSFDGDELRAPLEPAPDASRWEQNADAVGHA